MWNHSCPLPWEAVDVTYNICTNVARMEDTSTRIPSERNVEDIRNRVQAGVHMCVILMTMMSIGLYASTVVLRDPNEAAGNAEQDDGYITLMPQRIAPFKNLDAMDQTTRLYVHKSLTLPRTNFNIANLTSTVNVEPSRIVGIEYSTTLVWTSDADRAMNFQPTPDVYGLAGLYVSSQGGSVKYTALVRMNRSICQGRETSWTCQRNDNHASFDNDYCVIIMESHSLQGLLAAVKTAVSNGVVDMDENIVRGAYCGNPLLQRVAAGGNNVFMLNHKHNTENPSKDYYLCKYNTATDEVSQCIDLANKAVGYKRPLALLYDNVTDSVVSVQYSTQDKLNILVFEGQALNLKALFRPLPSPSGFLLHSEFLEGNIVFHGDLSLYEPDAILNLESGQDITVRPM